MVNRELRQRTVPETAVEWPVHIHPVLQRVYATRGVTDPTVLDHRLANIITPSLLGGIPRAVELLTEAIVQGKSIIVAGDYDCDGATGAAVAVRGLRLLGASPVGFVVPNRFTHGYGLSPALVESMQPTPDVIVTVDSGVASHDGVKAAKARGITVIITDHHLPGETLPAADAIVNPNLHGDAFPSKALAGVGVMFYLLLALRQSLRAAGRWAGTAIPDLATLLDLVALGTVADLVVLDQNNRILVEAGLRRIRQGLGCVGINTMIEAANKRVETLIAGDIAFSIAPRLNAAGRLENMSLGVETLITDDPVAAKGYVAQLDAINQERRDLQAEMVSEAERMVETTTGGHSVGITVFDPSWHAGVVGLVASKLKENLHRPVFAFAPAGEGSDEVRGSGRSIAGFHLRDALAVIDTKYPGLILKFGGHAMAAGLSLRTIDVDRFAEAFEAVATAELDAERLQAAIYTDGNLPVGDITVAMAQMVRQGGPWGQGFPEPVFENSFDCVAWRLMGENHLKLELRDHRDGAMVQGVYFFGYTGEAPPQRVHVCYELGINEWRGRESLQLMIRHLAPL